MTSPITFFVPGIPRPGGSKRGFVHKHTGRVIMTDAGGDKTKNWRAVVAHEGKAAMNGTAPLTGPLRLSVTFVLPRPRSHYRTGRHSAELRPDAPTWHTGRPDATKLLRSLEDALTGIAWGDDAQIADQHATKQYGTASGARVTIESMLPSGGAEPPT